MEQLQYRFLILAVIAIIFMIGIGIMIAEKSSIGTIACIIGLLVTMGYGFATKRKLRKE